MRNHNDDQGPDQGGVIWVTAGNAAGAAAHAGGVSAAAGPRTQGLLSAICAFRLLPRGFTNRDLRHHLAPLLGLTPEAMTSGQITYDLRRLRHHGLIERIPRTHRYQITRTGLRHALFLTRACDRLLHGGLAELAQPSKLRTAARAYEIAVDDLLTRAGLAA